VTSSAPDQAAPRKIILDCDPGIDDALAIVFACGHPGLELLGLTTVSGNVDLARTTANALAVRDFAGCPEVPVVAGSPAPLLRPVLDARRVHGDSGLGAARLAVSRSGARDGNAFDKINK
jgi:purine nucleosidase